MRDYRIRPQLTADSKATGLPTSQAGPRIYFIEDDVSTIKHELVSRGPVVATMETHLDFLS
jgi:hypothetical protein